MLCFHWNQPCNFLFGVLRRFQHCTGHITTGSWKGRGNQYIEFAGVVYCKLPTNGKQLPAFPLKAVTEIEPRPQRWEVRVLPLCHRGPSNPVTDPTTLLLVAKSCRVIEKKRRENAESLMKSPTGWYTYRQDVMTFPRRCRVGDVYCTASRCSTTTSPKLLTDKP